MKINSFYINPISKMGDVIVERIVIKFKGKIFDGYLHLLEHLWVRSNKIWIDDFENNLNIFNAMTESDKITFVFIYENTKNFLVNTDDLKFDLKFNIQDFLLEKNTIYEERRLYSNDVQSVNEILGSIETIENFDLLVLENMVKKMEYEITRFKFSSKTPENISRFLPQKTNISSIDWEEGGRIRVYSYYDYSLLQIIFKVFKIVNENFLYKVAALDKNYEITINNRELFNYMVLHRENILKKYQLLLSNLQLEIEQSNYLMDLLGTIPDISELWSSFNWKVLIS